MADDRFNASATDAVASPGCIHLGSSIQPKLENNAANDMKTFAPRTAEAIRAAVDVDPISPKIIQFDALVGAAAGGYQLVPVDHDPFEQ
jgi:hypothetical protein